MIKHMKVALLAGLMWLPAQHAFAQSNSDERPANTVGEIVVDAAHSAITGAGSANPAGAAAQIILTPSSTAPPAQSECGGPNYNCALPAPGAPQALPPPPVQQSPPVAQTGSAAMDSDEPS